MRFFRSALNKYAYSKYRKWIYVVYVIVCFLISYSYVVLSFKDLLAFVMYIFSNDNILYIFSNLIDLFIECAITFIVFCLPPLTGMEVYFIFFIDGLHIEGAENFVKRIMDKIGKKFYSRVEEHLSKSQAVIRSITMKILYGLCFLSCFVMSMVIMCLENGFLVIWLDIVTFVLLVLNFLILNKFCREMKSKV